MFIQDGIFREMKIKVPTPIEEGTVVNKYGMVAAPDGSDAYGIVTQRVEKIPDTGRIYVAVGGVIDMESPDNCDIVFSDDMQRELYDFHFIPGLPPGGGGGGGDYTAGHAINISESNVISVDESRLNVGSYTAGNLIDISDENVISVYDGVPTLGLSGEGGEVASIGFATTYGSWAKLGIKEFVTLEAEDPDGGISCETNLLTERWLSENPQKSIYYEYEKTEKKLKYLPVGTDSTSASFDISVPSSLSNKYKIGGIAGYKFTDGFGTTPAVIVGQSLYNNGKSVILVFRSPFPEGMGEPYRQYKQLNVTLLLIPI